MQGSMTPAALRDDLSAARARTSSLWEGLSDEQLVLPYLRIVNPVLWEAGHVAWFQEFWILRHAHGGETSMPRCDDLYDAAVVAHRSRWGLPLPDRNGTRSYLARTLDRVLESAERERDPYFYFLVLFHEDMHAEAMTYTRQTVGLPAPEIAAERNVTISTGEGEQIPIGEREVVVGASAGETFVFDNEKWAHPVRLSSFSIDAAPVTNRRYAEFVERGGYAERRHWTAEGWSWRTEESALHPRDWRRRASGDWEVRVFDRWQPLDPETSVVHVNAHEAEAFCHWADRRLPTEVEWEAAARSEHGLSNAGLVWKWTSSRFLPYAGFSPDPYKEYSEPWFATPHRVLRGGSWVTPSRLMRPGFRNFFEPHRRDIYAGFRTCGSFR
ncbi:MAG TPA: selenoneine synthase SenA [Thermoanaerobaculia bacterium]|nr:selenoneine synthase SenA [Thermoanaerobaculia bacterium]